MGATVKNTHVFLKAEEEQLWSLGVTAGQLISKKAIIVAACKVFDNFSSPQQAVPSLWDTLQLQKSLPDI